MSPGTGLDELDSQGPQNGPLTFRNLVAVRFWCQGMNAFILGWWFLTPREGSLLWFSWSACPLGGNLKKNFHSHIVWEFGKLCITDPLCGVTHGEKVPVNGSKETHGSGVHVKESNV